MRENIRIEETFPDNSFRLSIQDVYQINGRLIVIARVQRVSSAVEATAVTLCASMEVKTYSNVKLPQEVIYLVSSTLKEERYPTTGVTSLENIPELYFNPHLIPLVRVLPQVAQQINQEGHKSPRPK